MLLGILASSTPIGGDYESIATVTVGSGGAASITFSSIPSTYAHLQIRAIARTTGASSGGDNIRMEFNSDTTAANYYPNHQLFGDGASASAGVNTGTAYVNPMYINEGNTTANVFAAGVIDILDYASTNKNKTIRGFSGYDVNGATGYILLRSGLWMNNTTAINNIKMTLSNNFAQYSHFALYGIKSA